MQIILAGTATLIALLTGRERHRRTKTQAITPPKAIPCTGIEDELGRRAHARMMGAMRFIIDARYRSAFAHSFDALSTLLRNDNSRVTFSTQAGAAAHAASQMTMPFGKDFGRDRFGAG